MNYRRKDRLSQFFARQDGAVAVEFVILFPLFVLILMGIMEFGHLWYVDHVITNASREGARAGVVYVSPPTGLTEDEKKIWRQNWAQNTAEAAVANYLSGKLPGVLWRFNPDPPAAGDEPGDPLTVTITVSDAALILDLLGIPGFNPLSLTGATTMRME